MSKLVPGRECGECTICCTALTIDEPDIQKKSGMTCRHCSGGCTIYDTRLQICRTYYCGWRMLPIMDEAWRPDRSGVFAEIEKNHIPAHFKSTAGISLMLIDNPLRTVREPWFIAFVAASVAKEIPLFLVLPGPSGFRGGKLLLNTQPMIAAAAGPRQRVKELLELALQSLRSYPFREYTMVNSGHDVGRSAQDASATQTIQQG